MRNNPSRKRGCYRFAFLIFFFFSVLQSKAQWSMPDGSGNIHNTNSGYVSVKSSTTNAAWLFNVDPQGLGGIQIGTYNNGAGGYTNLTLAISAAQAGYSSIQSSKSSGSAWGTLGLNPGGGNVGIGTNTPVSVLEVATTLQNDGLKLGFNNNSGVVHLSPNLSVGGYNGISLAGDAGLFFGTNGATPNFGFVIAPWSAILGGIRITNYGNVLIGKSSQTSSAYLLDVNGPIRANGVVVNTTGADFVFDPGYRLLPLKELETYLRQEHHLPGIAPAGQMEKEGVNLGDNQIRLLAKVEELTLYIIQQEKQIKQLKERNRTLESLEQRIQRLEEQVTQ